jgi:Cys-tRNA(Pro)/Cys-tRNA(Cys) deacylase
VGRDPSIGHNGGMAKKEHVTGATPAVRALTQAGIEHTLHPYEHDPSSGMSYGLEAATALGVDPAQVFKTLCAHVDGRLCVGVVPVNGMLNLKALAAALGGKKAVMAQLADAERATGYVAGGISPVGQKTLAPTALDDSALGFDVIYVSGGRRGLDVGLAPADLIAVTRAVTAPIARAD